jgi:hypothetical protein
MTLLLDGVCAECYSWCRERRCGIWYLEVRVKLSFFFDQEHRNKQIRPCYGENLSILLLPLLSRSRIL